MKICIVGSYKWLDEDVVKAKAFIQEYLSMIKAADEKYGTVTTIISGECPKGGVDLWVKEGVEELGMSYVPYPPKAARTWAYMQRNREMAFAADVVVRVGSKVSTTGGSKYVIEIAKKRGIPCIDFDI